jgi:GT2 family glycosyltransferase
MPPTISVIMPVLNGERYIAEAIESICRQTCRDYEFVLVDDGSSDRTREIVFQYASRLKLEYVFHEKNQGITRSVNDGLKRASGEFIAFLDHDDLWLPAFLETQLTYLRTHADVGMVHSDFQTIDGEGRVLEQSVATARQRTRPSGQIFPELFMQSLIVGNSVLIRKECFDRVGLWDERLRWADYHMWLRIARHFKVDYVPQVLTAYRQHASQNTRGNTTRPPDEPPVAVKAIELLLQDDPAIRQDLGSRTVDRRIAELYFDLAYEWFSAGELATARFWIGHALRRWPANARYLGLYAATLGSRSQVRAAREAWKWLKRGTAVAGNARG